VTRVRPWSGCSARWIVRTTTYVGLVDEQLGLDRLRDAKLDRLLTDRGHPDRASSGKRSRELDLLDI